MNGKSAPSARANVGRRALWWAISCLGLPACAGRPAATAPTAAQVSSASAVDVQRAYADIRGIKIYYEVHGDAPGVPILLLHGGGSTIESWRHALPQLAQSRRVIAMEEQNHGRSGQRLGPQRFADSADDANALLQALGVPAADVIGFSNGATVALQIAIRHPQRVHRLVFASGLAKRSGVPNAFWSFMENGTLADLPQQLKDDFLRVNPNPVHLRHMYEKDAERMRSFADIPDDALSAVTAPTLLVGGDRDVIRVEHLVELSHLLPKARLLVLPAGHGDYLERGDASASIYPATALAPILDFLGAESL